MPDITEAFEDWWKRSGQQQLVDEACLGADAGLVKEIADAAYYAGRRAIIKAFVNLAQNLNH